MGGNSWLMQLVALPFLVFCGSGVGDFGEHNTSERNKGMVELGWSCIICRQLAKLPWSYRNCNPVRTEISEPGAKTSGIPSLG